MNHRNMLIPDFGPLNGMRVVCAGSLIAMPFAATMMADFGAEIIHVERPGVGDSMRLLEPSAVINGKKVSTAWAQDARNKLSLSLELDLNKPEVKEIFMGIIKEADVFMENMVWLEKLGIYDEELLAVNPKLVIVHVSGMGRQEFGGAPGVCGRASYDMIGQAYSGWLSVQGDPDRNPVLAKPYTNDFVTAFLALFGALIGYINAQKTGKGQVVDVAQFEAMAQYMFGYFTSYTTMGFCTKPTGNENPAFQPYGLFTTSDGKLVATGAFGPAVYKRCLKAMGFDPDYYTYAACSDGPAATGSPLGQELKGKILSWFATHTAAEAEETFAAYKVPCCQVNTIRDAVENEHFKAREDWITYEDQTSGGDVTAFGIAPKLSGTPGKVWRGSPALGQDTDAILTRLLGYDAEKIAELRAKGLI